MIDIAALFGSIFFNWDAFTCQFFGPSVDGRFVRKNKKRMPRCKCPYWLARESEEFWKILLLGNARSCRHPIEFLVEQTRGRRLGSAAK